MNKNKRKFPVGFFIILIIGATLVSFQGLTGDFDVDLGGFLGAYAVAIIGTLIKWRWFSYVKE